MSTYIHLQATTSSSVTSGITGASRISLKQPLRPIVPQHRRACSCSAFSSSSSSRAPRATCLGGRHRCNSNTNDRCCRSATAGAVSSNAAVLYTSSSGCRTEGRILHRCPSSSSSSSEHARDVCTAAAAAAACPFPDAAGPHVQSHQRQHRRRSSSSSSTAEQPQPDLYRHDSQGFAGPDSFLGLGFRHSMEEAFKAFVQVPAGSRQLPEQPQQQPQQQQQQQQEYDHATTIAERVDSSRCASTSAAAAGSSTATSANALTRQIQGCKSAAALELLLQQHWKQLDHIHVAAAYVQLVRVQKGNSSSSKGSSSRDLMTPASMQWLQQLAAHHLPQMHSRHLANILWASAALNLTAPDAWLQGLTDKAQTLFHKGTTPQGFANIIWAVAVLRVQVSPQWIGDFFAASQPHLYNFQPQEMSSTIWSLATLAVQPPAGWQYSFATASTAKMGSCNAQSLSNQFWAVAKLGLVMPGPWLAAVTYACHIRAQEFTPVGLSNLLWAAAKLAGKMQQQQQYAAAAAEWSQPHQQQQQGSVLVTAGSLSSSTQWIQPLLAAAAPKLQQHNAHTLSNIVWALGVLDHRSSPEFLDQCLQQLLSKVDQLTAAGASAALWGFSKLGVLPAPQQLSLLQQQLQLVLPKSNAQQLIYIAAALAFYKQQQKQQVHVDTVRDSQLITEPLLQQYLSVCSQQLQQQQFGPGQACQLGRWLAAAAVQPEAQWTDNYLLHLAQQLPRLNPSHHVTILKTVAAWRVKPHAGWSAIFLAAVAAEQRVTNYTAGHIGSLLQDLAAAALEPQQQQIEVLLQQVLNDTAQVSAASTAAVLHGLCALGFRPSQQWLQRFWDVSEPGLKGSTAAAVTALAVALQLPQLRQLQIRPSKLWSVAYHAAVAAVLHPNGSSSSSTLCPGLSPREAAAVLTALAAVQRPPKQEQQVLLLDLMSAAAGGDGLQQLSLQEVVGSWWALVEFGVLQEAVPLTHIHTQQQQQPFMQQGQQQQPSGVPEQQQEVPSQQQQQQQQQQQWHMQQWQVHWLHHLFLPPDAVDPQLGQLSIHSLLQLSDALGRLQQPTPGSWAASYAAALSPHIPQLAPHQLVAVLCGVPALGGFTAQPGLTDQILTALQADLGQLSPKQLSEVIAMVQQSGARPSESWLSDFMSATEACLPRFLGRQVIRVLVSLARMRFIPESRFVTAAADVAVEKCGSGVPPALLVDLIWALTALRVSPTAAWMARFEARMLEKGLGRLDAHSISRFGWCLGALQRRPGQLLMARYLVAAQEQHCNMDARSLADTIWSCAMLDEKPNRQWLDSFVAESRKHLPTFSSSALVTVMWALALLQHRPPSDWMHRCLAAVSACLSINYAAAAAATAAVAPRAAVGSSSSSGMQLLQRPQLPSTAAAMGHFAPQHLASLTPSQVTNLVWSLAALDCQVPDQLMQLLTWQAESVISAVDSDDLAQLVWALDRLDETQDKVWVRRFAATARAQLLAATAGVLTHPGGFQVPTPQGSTPAAAMAAAGFRQLPGLSGMGQVVMIRPSRAAGATAAGQQVQLQQQQTNRLVATAGARHSATRIPATGFAEGITKSKHSKQELYAKLVQLQQMQQ